ncbi:helix-turn-helix domain-containing protein [Lactobacillus sp. PV034]|uniref:helix-turn-helix domain-containing protein n=1 Tax=Lactobacillus sp. PV034 TaxID=2594495 RepID=UPI002240A2EB|nr:helix-turn-helix transcriptional regulator [Lactobacillus sp. PV034]QNQ81450.1 helix-turn-helix transcriptional regulator [Lactobacillus sp. PV034]
MNQERNIGKFLYQERKKRGLTQKEFVRNIISVSQYSRVEQGQQDLRTIDFFKIININKIKLNELMTAVNEEKLVNENSDDEILKRLANAFYDRNLVEIKSIKEKYRPIKLKENIVLQATLMESILQDNLKNLDPIIIKKLSQKLNEADEWTTNKVFLQLFGSSMMIFDMQRLSIYMKKIIRTYMNKISQYSFETQRRIGSICINYLGRAYQEQDQQLLTNILKLLENMSANPDMLMYKLLGKYFESLFKNDRSQSEEILEILSLSGYKKFIVNLPK